MIKVTSNEVEKFIKDFSIAENPSMWLEDTGGKELTELEFSLLHKMSKIWTNKDNQDKDLPNFVLPIFIEFWRWARGATIEMYENLPEEVCEDD